MRGRSISPRSFRIKAPCACLIRWKAGTRREWSDSRTAFLAAVRDVMVSVARLDDIDEALTVRADVAMKQGSGRVYEIAVTAGAQTILTGRINVMGPRAKG